MEVIPSIDLKGGRCVRLYQGDYKRETVFSDDPVGTARQWESLGATRLHLIDLDGAAKGEPCHLKAIGEIAGALKIPVQAGGGIRKMEAIRQLLNIGAQRVILGTAAVENPTLVREACQQYGEAIIVSIDARGRYDTTGIQLHDMPLSGHVVIGGWQKNSNITALELIQQMITLGARRFIYTEIMRDGTLTQPNFDAIAEIVNSTKFPIIASGGVTSISHLRKLSQLGVEGAIIGRALYTGDIKLEEALAALYYLY